MPPEPLDERAVAHYRQHGWLRLGPLLDVEAAARLRAEEKRLRLDVGYGRLEPMTDIAVWIALVDTDERNGAA